MRRGGGLRRDGAGARRFAGWDRPAPDENRPASGLTPSQMRSARTPPATPRDATAAPVAKPGPPRTWPNFSNGKRQVKKRSMGVCELGWVCRGHGAHTETHHRKLRRHGDHRPVNLIGLCQACHHHIHNNPNPKQSYEMGWLVRSTDQPERIPCFGRHGVLQL